MCFHPLCNITEQFLSGVFPLLWTVKSFSDKPSGNRMSVKIAQKWYKEQKRYDTKNPRDIYNVLHLFTFPMVGSWYGSQWKCHIFETLLDFTNFSESATEKTEDPTPLSTDACTLLMCLLSRLSCMRFSSFCANLGGNVDTSLAGRGFLEFSLCLLSFFW